MNRYFATAALASLLLLTGCVAAEPETPADPVDDSGAVATPDDAVSGASALASITSCDQVADAVAPYIEGLVPSESNVVDEWGVSCSWETAEDETDLANNRSVEVGIVATEANAEKPDASGVAAMEGGALIEDDWVSERDGIAFSLTLGTAVAAAISTTVWVPGAEARITGGQWADFPALDGPAAVQVMKTLLPSL